MCEISLIAAVAIAAMGPISFLILKRLVPNINEDPYWIIDEESHEPLV